MIDKSEFVDQVHNMCRLGVTDEERAEHFEVCVRTIYRWRNTHEAFAEANLGTVAAPFLPQTPDDAPGRGRRNHARVTRPA